MKIFRLESINVDIVPQLELLLRNLGHNKTDIDVECMNMSLINHDMDLFVAEVDNMIAGMLTLTHCQTLTRKKYWIEDVVVEEKHRGKGIGRALVKEAIAHAKTVEDDPAIYLTSNPSRIAARNIYMSEGFEEYETGVFIHKNAHSDKAMAVLFTVKENHVRAKSIEANGPVWEDRF